MRVLLFFLLLSACCSSDVNNKGMHVDDNLAATSK